MKTRLARKIWKARDRSLFPSPRDYWAVKWSNTQFYENARYDHRIARCEKIMFKLIENENEKEVSREDNNAAG